MRIISSENQPGFTAGLGGVNNFDKMNNKMFQKAAGLHSRAGGKVFTLPNNE